MAVVLRLILQMHELGAAVEVELEVVTEEEVMVVGEAATQLVGVILLLVVMVVNRATKEEAMAAISKVDTNNRVAMVVVQAIEFREGQKSI